MGFCVYMPETKSGAEKVNLTDVHYSNTLQQTQNSFSSLFIFLFTFFFFDRVHYVSQTRLELTETHPSLSPEARIRGMCRHT